MTASEIELWREAWSGKGGVTVVMEKWWPGTCICGSETLLQEEHVPCWGTYWSFPKLLQHSLEWLTGILEGKMWCSSSLFLKSQKAELLIRVLWVRVINWRCTFTIRSKSLHAFWFPVAAQTVLIKSLTMWPMQGRERWHLPAGGGGSAGRQEGNVTRKDPSWKYKQWLLASEVPGLQSKRAALQFLSRWESLSLPFVLLRPLQVPSRSWLHFGWLYWGSCSALLFGFIF